MSRDVSCPWYRMRVPRDDRILNLQTQDSVALLVYSPASVPPHEIASHEDQGKM